MKSVSERCLEEGRTFFCQERLDKMREKKIAQIYIYIYIYRKHKARWIERCQALILAR